MNFNNNKQNGDMSDMFDDCVWARERERLLKSCQVIGDNCHIELWGTPQVISSQKPNKSQHNNEMV